MSNFISVGFPRMQKEAGEKRAFLPDFIQFFARQGVTIVLKKGMVRALGFTFDDYRQVMRVFIPAPDARHLPKIWSSYFDHRLWMNTTCLNPEQF
jgi:hypothetical protein